MTTVPVASSAEVALRLLGVLAMVATGLVFPGCASVSWVDPKPTPGYGRQYAVILDTGQPAAKGIMIARSRFEAAPEMVRVFDIREGTATLPELSEVRFSWYTGMTSRSFIGKFMNAESTYLYPLVPGYLPGERYFLGDGGANNFTPKRLPPNVFKLTKCDADTELDNLQTIDSQMQHCPEEQRESDRRARDAIRQYIGSRIRELQQTGGQAAK
jgi:hypothetical protein